MSLAIIAGVIEQASGSLMAKRHRDFDHDLGAVQVLPCVLTPRRRS